MTNYLSLDTVHLHNLGGLKTVAIKTQFGKVEICLSAPNF